MSTQPTVSSLPQPRGLSGAEVLALAGKFGPNTLPDPAIRPFRRAASKLWSPVPWMLEAAIILELILGKHLEALIIGVLLAFNAVLGYVQEGRAQATLAALKTRLALNVSVLRDSHWAMVLAASLVPGDVVKLSLGSIVAADVRINTGEVLLDQSMLTGESIPVEAGPGFQTFAGALVRRGEAVAEVTATGSGTKFGRTAELVLSAHAESSQQKAVLHLVRNLSIFNGALILVMVAYARHLNMHTGEIIPLVLTAVLASIPVALPATFTLAAAIGARDLGRLGVLPTRLSAVDEAASIDVLCADKTGTLTLNELGVSDTRAMAGFDVAHVLGLAALASSDGGNDSVDAAIRAEAAKAPAPGMPVRSAFVPFDPATKLAEATTRDSSGGTVRVIKGAFEVVAALAGALPDSPGIAAELEAKGMRVLAVAVGPAGALKLAGIIGLSDSPRADSAALVAELGALGVRTVMITGDAPATAAIVAKAVGLSGAVSPPGPIPKGVRPEDFAVYAGVLPEGKFNLVKAFQGNGHVVGMCGDGANDAPALRQAQMGIAVSTATDVAKSAAGIVLTKPGLGGIVASVKEGRVTFQRILTYALNSVTKKVVQVLFLAVGLFMTGHSILTPMLMVIIMLSGDLLGMSLATDNVKASGRPNSWRIGNLTAAGVFMGVSELAYCVAAFSIAKFLLGYGIDALRTVAFVAIVFGNQATTYANRERGRMGASLPSPWLVGSSAVDVAIASTLAACGVAMTGMPVMMIAGLLAAAALFAFALDFAKVPVLRRLSLD